LIRKILAHANADLQSKFGGSTLGTTLLTPTKIYAHCILPLFSELDLHALAHITGGGITENLPRVLPEHLSATIDTASWKWPAIFKWLQEQGNVATDEMYRTFNCGVGMIVCLPAEQAQLCIAAVEASGEQAWQIGEIKAKADPAQDAVQFI
jgi:phosphoribosylformylglycinamidine cyclo-ligase